MTIRRYPLTGGGSSGGGGGGGVASGLPHDHDVTIDRYTDDIETWEHTSDVTNNRMYQTGIEVDTTKEYIHIGLVISGDTLPRQMVYNRVRTAEWLALELDDTGNGLAFEEEDVQSGILAYATDDRFNTIVLHIRRYQDADDNNLLAVGFMFTGDTPGADLRGIKYFYEDKEVTATTTESEDNSGSSGGGGAGEYLADTELPDPLEAAHVGRLYWSNGHLLKVVLRHRDGDLTITWTDYLPVSTPSSNNVGALWGLAADAYRFRGIVARGNQIIGPTDDDVYVNPGGGWFKYNSTSGGAIGWVHLGPPTGWQGVVMNMDDAQEQVTADDQVFAWGNGLHVSSDYARTDEIAAILAEEFDPNAGLRAVVEFWGHGQTEAFPAEAVVRATIGTSLAFRYRFAQEVPIVRYGHDFGVRAVDADQVENANLMPGETSLLDQQVIRFPPGTYRIEVFGGHRAAGDTNLGGWLYRIQAGADDLELYYGSGFSNSQAPPIGTLLPADRTNQVIEFTRILTFTETTDITIIVGDFSSSVNASGNFDVIVEKLG